MPHHRDTRRPSRHLFYASPGRFSSTLLLSTFFLGACDATSRPGDTLGLQTSARWEWHARLVVERDPTLTLVRLRIDTTQGGGRSEEHTSELQSPCNLVCRLLLEKKKQKINLKSLPRTTSCR